jgi:beta-1,4-N-acetylglucosaminyltransferase
MQPTKVCLVTVGATASFDSLVAAALSAAFLQALSEAQYTRLIVQYGDTGQPFFEAHLQKARGDGNGELPAGLLVEGFGYRAGDFKEVVRLVREGVGGMLIAHAGLLHEVGKAKLMAVTGSGSLMDGLTFGVPTVLVPNPSLLNNHQEELAQEAEKAGYCIRGDLRSAG